MEAASIELKRKVEMGLEEIRPFLKNDGGDISLIDIDEETNIVKVRLEGACVSCTVNQMTLKSGVELTIKKHAPQIQKVVNIEPVISEECVFMAAGKNIGLSETAFMTSIFRAQNAKLSGDKYAYLWGDEQSKHFAQKFLSRVSTEENFAHCLRNRYFLDQIELLWNKGQIDCLINFGGGFSMYPFVLPDGLKHIEIDLPKIVEVKQNQIEKWIEEGLLEKRDIEFIGADFNAKDLNHLRTELNQKTEGKQNLILIEGVLFFLSRDKTTALFEFFNDFQSPGDYIGSVSYLNKTLYTAAFERLRYFLAEELSDNDNINYQTLPKSFYQSQKGYQLLDHQDYFSLSKTYDNAVQNKPDDILNENFYLLKKINQK